MITKPDTSGIASRPCPVTTDELCEVIRCTGAILGSKSFDRLEEAITRTPGFIETTLPFIWREAQRPLREIPLLDSAGAVELTQLECLGLLANAFLCTYRDRPSINCYSGEDLPSINFDEMYGGRGWGSVEVAKLQMFFNYFEQQRLRLQGGDTLSRRLRFVRAQAVESTVEDWSKCDSPLLSPAVHDLRESIDDARHMLRVDFANCSIGGAAIAYGCVQEEIMFCVFPELVAARLFCPVMQPDEAIMIAGAEQFSIATGYAGSLGYGGAFDDPTPVETSGMLGSYVTAIDALDFRGADTYDQYKPELIVRELTKGWTGFNIPDTPDEIATGNWGCGVFLGDVELKSIIQWMACSRAGKTMHYFPWENYRVHAGLPELSSMLANRSLTVGEIANHLFKAPKKGSIYVGLREAFAQ